MKKTMALIMALAFTLAMAATPALAHCGKCPGDKASAKKSCAHGEKDQACAHRADVDKAVEALKADLDKMGKEMSPEELSAFLKAHKENLEKFFGAREACMKACAAGHDSKSKSSKT